MNTDIQEVEDHRHQQLLVLTEECGWIGLNDEETTKCQKKKK